jgi:hypothetical protein
MSKFEGGMRHKSIKHEYKKGKRAEFKVVLAWPRKGMTIEAGPSSRMNHAEHNTIFKFVKKNQYSAGVTPCCLF